MSEETYIKVSLFYGEQRQGSFVEPLATFDKDAWFGEMSTGDEYYRIEAVDMTKEQYDALPEFEGF